MKYQVIAPIESASGIQMYEVEASSIAEARKLWMEGKCEFVCEEIEVQNLGEPEITEIKDGAQCHPASPASS